MDIYSVFKFLHIATAITWLGGGGVLLALGLIASRLNNNEDLFTVARFSGQLALRWFVPSSVLTLVFGVVTTTLGGLWAEAWVTLALIGFAATFCIGNFVLRPSADKIEKLSGAGDQAGAMLETHRILQINKFDSTMLFVVVADMVLKPSWSDLVPLAIMALVLIVGAALFLSPNFRNRAA
jgi:uncharacterized membrane protein